MCEGGGVCAGVVFGKKKKSVCSWQLREKRRLDQASENKACWWEAVGKEKLVLLFSMLNMNLMSVNNAACIYTVMTSRLCLFSHSCWFLSFFLLWSALDCLKEEPLLARNVFFLSLLWLNARRVLLVFLLPSKTRTISHSHVNGLHSGIFIVAKS